MALFGGLSERLNHIFSKLTKRGKLTELEIRTAMREVRVALLEADVNLRVAKQFIAEGAEKGRAYRAHGLEKRETRSVVQAPDRDYDVRSARRG